MWSLHWLPWRGRAVDVAPHRGRCRHSSSASGCSSSSRSGESVLIAGGAFVADGALRARAPGRADCRVHGHRRAVVVLLRPCGGASAVGVGRGGRATPAPSACAGRGRSALLVLGLLGDRGRRRARDRPPGRRPTLGFTLLCFGGPALFLLAQTLFIAEDDRTTSRARASSRSACLVALALAALDRREFTARWLSRGRHCVSCLGTARPGRRALPPDPAASHGEMATAWPLTRTAPLGCGAVGYWERSAGARGDRETRLLLLGLDLQGLGGRGLLAGLIDLDELDLVLGVLLEALDRDLLFLLGVPFALANWPLPVRT